MHKGVRHCDAICFSGAALFHTSFFDDDAIVLFDAIDDDAIVHYPFTMMYIINSRQCIVMN